MSYLSVWVNSGMCLRLISKKIGHLLLIAASMELLAHGSGNFGHDPSFGKFLDFVGRKHQQSSGNTAYLDRDPLSI